MTDSAMAPLQRGRYVLPTQSQAVGRDLCMTELLEAARAGNVRVMGYMLTDEQVEERKRGGPFLPYRFLVYSPSSCALNWKAFMTREEFDLWLETYQVKLEAEPVPGKQLFVIIPPVEVLEAMPAVIRSPTCGNPFCDNELEPGKHEGFCPSCLNMG